MPRAKKRKHWLWKQAPPKPPPIPPSKPLLTCCRDPVNPAFILDGPCTRGCSKSASVEPQSAFPLPEKANLAGKLSAIEEDVESEDDNIIGKHEFVPSNNTSCTRV